MENRIAHLAKRALSSVKRGIFSSLTALLRGTKQVVGFILIYTVLTTAFTVAFYMFISGEFDKDKPQKELSEYPVFYVYLDGEIVRELSLREQLAQLVQYTYSWGNPKRVVNIKHLRKTFNSLAANEELQVIVLELGQSLSGSLVDRLELARIIKTLRENTDASIYALSESGFGPYDYLIASAADKVVVGDNSLGVIVTGEGGGAIYTGALLSNLGVSFYHASTGDHKTSGETRRLTEMSDGQRDNIRAIISERWRAWKQVINGNRPDKINLDAYPSLAEDNSEATVLDTLASRFTDAYELADGDGAALALATGLADLPSSEMWKQIAATLEISYREFFRDRSSQVADYDDFFGGLPSISTLYEMLLRTDSEAVEKSAKAKLGLLRLKGVIHTPSMGSPNSGGITLTSVRRKLAKLAEKDVDALVVEINSPGGEIIASELVRQEIHDFARAHQIPIYIWMGSVAASGGYWIATLGEKIYAHPVTITGSIGVVFMMPNLGKFTERYGINLDQESTHPSNDAFSIPSLLLKPLDPRVQQLVETSVANHYSDFIQLVSTSRGIPPPRVEELAGGRVYGAFAAQENGLIDEVANRKATYKQIAEELGKKEYTLVAESNDDTLGVGYLSANVAGGMMQSGTSAELMRLTDRLLDNQWGISLDMLISFVENQGEPLVLCVDCLDVDS